MRPAPEVSVILPAYRAEGTIAAALAALRGQSLRDIEIIVVNDASPDRTAEIARSVAAQDDRVSVLDMERNGGPGLARNLGLTHARGRWIALLDADDRYLPERLARLTALGAERDADMVADDLLLIGDTMPENARLLDAQAMPTETWLDATAFIEGNMGDGASRPRTLGFLKPILRHSFLQQHGLTYPAARFAEDFLFYLECLLAGARWLLTPDAFYCYVQRTGSLTSGHAVDDLAFLAAAEQEILNRPIMRERTALAEALRRHQRSVELAASWMRFALAVKSRDFARAGALLLRSRPEFAHITQEGMRAVTRTLRSR